MKIAVLVKQVPDTEEVRIDPKTREPDASQAARQISLYDKNAIEAAVQIKESTDATVVCVSLGGDALDETLREVLAMGADEAVALKGGDFEGLDQLGKARALAGAIEHVGDVDLVIAAEESADSHSASTAPMVAEFLGWALLSYVDDIELGDGTIKVNREIDEGIEVLEADLPAVISVVESINEPRLPALMQILQAKNKPLTELSAADVGIDAPTAHIRIVENKAPEQARKQEVQEADSPDEAADWILSNLKKEGVL